jgi:hypothetical protein
MDVLVTYTPMVGAAATVDAVIMRRSEPILRGGQITIDEDHYQGQIALADLAAEPVIGDTLTTAGAVVYRVDTPPTRKEAWWVLALRRLD